jgi:hypothetical protein
MKSRPFKILGPHWPWGIASVVAPRSVVPRCHRRGSLHPLNKICVSVRDAVRDFQGQSCEDGGALFTISLPGATEATLQAA